MQHRDLKNLLWGIHLTRMLGVCGLRHPSADPAPRIVHAVPHWYQRLSAILTIVALVAVVHSVYSAMKQEPDASPWWDGTQAAALDTTAWTRWVGGHPPDSSKAVLRIPGSRLLAEATNAPWLTGNRPPGTVGRRRAETGRGKGNTFQLIQVTAYTSRPSETDSTPSLTATNTKTKPGTIALSRDLLRTFTPGAPFDFGDKVLIPGVGVFEAHDTMHPRWKGKADIWFTSPAKARAWGRRTVFVTKVNSGIPTVAGPGMASRLR
jgi:3D (Asp-Asp-Asp) domain-containing protein